MPNGEVFTPVGRPQIIADRIGPIFDPAFLKLIPKEKLKDVAVIQLQAQANVLRKELDACFQIIEVIKEMKLK
ncbi:MAG: hypothetical protein C4B58_16005 [Deltaproteobacteria bacterium]|nr:MAG: hypothetical protein C4B58_16005 [Deltaproteobacteria bacterium]